jgi:glycopeptide antibiotics resistance protein
VSVEALQIYSHERFPSTTDVVCNVAGAVAAAVMARRISRSFNRPA